MKILCNKPVTSLLACLFLLAGCGDGQQFLSLGTAGTGGIYYPLGGALASRMSLADPIRQYTAEVSGGSVENINRLADGQMDLGMVLAVTAYQAQFGSGDMEPVPGLRIVAPLYPNLTHVMVPRNSTDVGIGDLGGKRVSVGPPGSGTEQMARHLLAAHGLTYDDVEPRYLSFSESSSALRDGAIDAAVISVGYPAAAVLEATTTAGVRLLPVDPEVITSMREEHPYYSVAEIPGGAYPGVDETLTTAAVHNWIVAMDTLDDEVVEVLLNILANDRASLEQVHDMAAQIDLARLSSAPITLHSATERWVVDR
ncbi:MAG: TAXI family TRAP transporter solute-binding subunit [Gemmatimonadetes bacterium]|nr:TAXI family TRAP transporter solute-binding subunit [Gemmatimonadota bacterium]